MELALYHPGDGYYSGPDVFGASGDYFTSPAAHPVFGVLLTLQMHRMWEVMGRPRPFVVVEMGAGNGRLAEDLLSAAATMLPAFAESLRYVALDRYPALGGPSGPHRVLAEGVPLAGVAGCFVSNELVDSFPVHRFQIDRGEVREVYVTVDDNEDLSERLGKPSTPRLAERLSATEESLPGGFRGEVNLNVAPWMEEVSAALERGFVVTIDYGNEAAEFYAATRSRGTLQTHYRHTYGSSPYQRIGRQDITSHVDFTHMAEEGGAVGLQPLALLTQAQYLTGLGFQSMLRRIRSMGLGQRERDANVMAMLELVKPEGLGGFRVLIQEKGTGLEDVRRLAPAGEQIEALCPPLLGADHMPLLEGRYPHLTWQPDRPLPPKEA